MRSLVSLIFVNVAVITVIIGLVFSLRQWGLQQKHAPLPHAIFSKMRVFADGPALLKRGESLSSFSAQFWPLCDAEGKRWFGCQRGSGLGEELISLEELAKNSFNTVFLFELQAKDARAISALIEQLNRWDLGERTAYVSSYQTNLSEMRKSAPRWAFGLPPQLLSKIFLMEAVYLEPFVSIPFDFIFFPLEWFQKRKSVRWLEEIARRKLPLIVDLRDQLPEQISFSSEIRKVLGGVVTSRPSEWSFQLLSPK